MKNKNALWVAFAVLFAGAFTSCKKIEYDYIDGKTPDERSTEFMQQVREKLLSADNGWVAYMYIPTNKRGYTFYMQFKEQNRVSMYSDFADTTMTKPKESSYSLRNTGIPSLIFDTYSYIHLPADPNKSVSGGSSGEGLSSDFEYSVLKMTEDSIILKGNLKNCDLTMVKITNEERSLVEEGKLSALTREFISYFNEKQNNYISLNGSKLGINLTHGSRQVSYQILKDDGSVKSYSGTFFYSVRGLEFSRDFVYEGIQFVGARFKGDRLYLMDASGKEYEMLQNKNPLTPLAASFQYGDTYTKMHIEGEKLPAGVNSGWNKIYGDMVKRFNNASGRTILYMDFYLQNSGKARVAIRYQATSGSQYTADAEYDYTIEGDVITLSNYVPSISNSNWNTRTSEIGEIVDYFKNRSFKIDWVEGSGEDALGGLYPVDTPGDYFYGVLQ